MFTLRTALFTLLSIALSGASPQRVSAAPIERLGLYVVVSDLEASTAFYQAFFEAPPSVRAPGFVGFTVAGGIYALVSREAFAPDSVHGDNVVPYLRVADIERAFDRVRRISPARPPAGIRDEGPLRLFRFADPDGNIIELFEVASPD